MLKLKDGIVELYKKVATSIPPDIESSLKKAYESEEENSGAQEALGIILNNIQSARASKRPVCQDTGVPVFDVKIPRGLNQKEIYEIIMEATVAATEKIPLRANCVDSLTDINSGNNTGTGSPVVYIEESEGSSLVIDLMLKGAGCENAGLLYKLPDQELNAHRNLEGVKKTIVDAVLQTQGKACPPYTIGVGIGGTRDQVTLLSKKLLFKKINEENPVPELAELERKVAKDINKLGIGPLGLKGNSTILGVKIAAHSRHPASFFVDISFACWAHRRGRLIWS